MSDKITLINTHGLDKPIASLTPTAVVVKRDTLALAQSIVAVTDAASQEAAGKALVAVKTLLKQAEEARAAIKAPVLAFGKEIDSIAKIFTTELDAESRRLSLLVGTFQEQERAKAAKIAEAARRAEEQCLAALANEQRDRVAEERNGRTGTLTADIQAMQKEAIADVMAIRQEAAAATVAAPEGAGVRKTWKFEVLDIAALFAARPDLCKIEPDNAAIRAAIKKCQKIPGLRIWSESAAFVRTAPSTAGAIKIALPKVAEPVDVSDDESPQNAVVDNGDY